MRKADYLHLAAVINAEVSAARATLANAATHSDRTASLAALTCATQIADEFASRASVDRAAFLTACGIDA